MAKAVTAEIDTSPMVNVGSLVEQAGAPAQSDWAERTNEIRQRVKLAEHQAGLEWSLLSPSEVFQVGSPGGLVAAALVAAHVYLRLAADLRKVSLDPFFGWDDASNRTWSNPVGMQLQRVALQLDRRREELYPFLCAYEQSPLIEGFLRHFLRPAADVSYGHLRANDCEVLQGALMASLAWAEDATRRKKHKRLYDEARKAKASARDYLQALPSTRPLSVMRVELTPQPALPDLYKAVTPMVGQLLKSTEVVDLKGQGKLRDQHVFKSYSAQLTAFLDLFNRDLKQALVGYSIKQEFKPGVGTYFNAFLFFDGGRWADFGILRDVVNQLWSATRNAHPATADEAAHFAGRWSFPAGHGPDWDEFVRQVLARQADHATYRSLRLPAGVRGYRRGTVRGKG